MTCFRIRCYILMRGRRCRLNERALHVLLFVHGDNKDGCKYFQNEFNCSKTARWWYAYIIYAYSRIRSPTPRPTICYFSKCLSHRALLEHVFVQHFNIDETTGAYVMISQNIRNNGETICVRQMYTYLGILTHEVRLEKL